MIGRAMAVAFLLVVALSGAADAQARRITIQLRGFDYLVMLDTVAYWIESDVTPGQAYTVLRYRLNTLDIPISAADSARGLLHHRGFIARSRLAGKRMSWALRCGSGMTGAYADIWRITIAYAVFIDPLPENRSRIGVALAAGADDIEGASKPSVQCATTGLLEQELLKDLRRPRAR